MSILFSENDGGFPLDGPTRRRFQSLDPSLPHVARVREVLDRIGEKYEAPGWRGRAVAHFVLPRLKMSICMFSRSARYSVRARHINEWADEGWKAGTLSELVVHKLHREGRLETEITGAIRIREKELGGSKKSRTGR